MHAEKPKFNRAGGFARIYMHEALERMRPSFRRAYAEVVRTSTVTDGQRLTRITNREIADASSKSESWAEKAVRELFRAGLIECVERDRSSIHRPRGIRIVDAAPTTKFVDVPESHPVWGLSPTGFWTWVTLRRCVSRDHETEARNGKIERIGALTPEQRRCGISELARAGIITIEYDASNVRRIMVPLDHVRATVTDTTPPPVTDTTGTRNPGQGAPVIDATPPPVTDTTPNNRKNLLEKEPYRRNRERTHPQPPTGAVGGVLLDGPNSRPHKPEPEPRTPIDPFEGWPEQLVKLWKGWGIGKNPNSVKREWIDSGFLGHVFDETTKRIENYPLSIRDPAGYVAKRLSDDAFRAFHELREYQARQAEIQRRMDVSLGRFPAATESAMPLDQVKPIARPNPPAAETRAEPASAAPRESTEPEPPRKRIVSVAGRIEPANRPREDLSNWECLDDELLRLNAEAIREKDIQSAINSRFKRWEKKLLMSESAGTMEERFDRIRAERPAKRAEIEAIVRKEFKPVQADRTDWPTGRTDPDQKAKAPGTRRIGANV